MRPGVPEARASLFAAERNLRATPTLARASERLLGEWDRRETGTKLHLPDVKEAGA
jgi:hypothetical protein